MPQTPCPACGRYLETKQIPITYVNQTDVPAGHGYWDDILEKIPTGKALVIPDSAITERALIDILTVRKRKGKFTNYKVTYREETKSSYIINFAPLETPFKIVNQEEAGTPHRTEKEWEKLFQTIPEGKALLIPKTHPLQYATTKEALKRLQAKGKFKNLFVTKRGNLYVVNPKQEEPKG